MSSLVSPAPPAPESSLAATYAAANLADAFVVRLGTGSTHDVRVLAQHVFSQQPRWVSGLLALRDRLVRPFGLKTSRDLSQDTRHERIGFFRVYGATADEAILGEDDRHLDFRVSVLRRAGRVEGDGSSGGNGNGSVDDAACLVVTTVVHCHNRLGRTYIALIRPFHRWVVKGLLGAAARRRWPVA